MSDMALEIARMVDMLPEDEQRLTYEVIKRFVIAWDPDFTKLTPEEAHRLEEAELSGYVDEEELDTFFDIAEDEEVETISEQLMEQNEVAYRELSVYDKMKMGLEEAIAFERGELPSHTSKMTIQPVDVFDADDIQNIRTVAEMTQTAFAEFMGVSVETIEAWESGRNQPTGPACRLLALTKADPHFPMKAGICYDDQRSETVEDQ